MWKCILSHFAFSKFSPWAEIDVHCPWLSSIPNPPGEETFIFPILHDLEQLVQHPTRIPECLGNQPNILDIL